MSFETPFPPYNASDPTAVFVNASCLDFLLIEIVPLAQRMADELVGGSEHRGGSVDEEARRDLVFRRLEGLGYRVGQGLVERFSRDRPRFADNLDVIKFLCKDLWTLLFRKQIDNLKTNHRGVYVLTDSAFKPFSRMSMRSSTDAVARAQTFLWFPCGVIRGSLASMGITATVQAESTGLPSAVFQIKSAVSRP